MPRSTLILSQPLVCRTAAAAGAPERCDILIMDGKIAALGPGLAAAQADGRPIAELGGRPVDRVIDCSGLMALPGFVSAHYHSHDVLLRGSFESMPLDFWAAHALPQSFPKRSTQEIRIRTLLGAMECLRGGITTVQDLLTLHPFDEAHLEAVLQAYEDIGIRCVFALQIGDRLRSGAVPFWEDLAPPEADAEIGGYSADVSADELLARVEAAAKAHAGRHRRITWALGPSGPERCSPKLLAGLADIAQRLGLRMFTHIYQAKAEAVVARSNYAAHGRSLVQYLKDCGALTPRMGLVHNIWIAPQEVDLVGESGASMILNPASNIKTRSGIAPIARLRAAPINLALGTDNCSCSDAQSMFQAMKLFSLLPGVIDPLAGTPPAADALRAATLGGAAALGLAEIVGDIDVGMAADITLLDLSDPIYHPLNDPARQVVYSEAGRGVRTVLVDGQIVVSDGKLVSIDEAAIYRELLALTPRLREDALTVRARMQKLAPYYEKVFERALTYELEFDRYAGR